MNRHTDKLAAKAQTHKVKEIKSQGPALLALVESGRAGDDYIAELEPTGQNTFDAICTCPFGSYHPGKACSHTLALAQAVWGGQIVDAEAGDLEVGGVGLALAF